VIGSGGIRYPTVEAAFQAGKTCDQETKLWIAQARTPEKAKRRSRAVSLVPGWDDNLRHVVMRAVLAAKFADPELVALLPGHR
jgi:predicted NAD-dependent protein-ADP-ribosyltransferase YbiA (DUF1768 family)